MTLKSLVVAGVFSIFCWTAAASSLQLGIAPPREPRLVEFNQWLRTLLRHEPGHLDDGIKVVGRRTNSDLDALFVYANAIIQLIRNPNLTSRNASPIISFSVAREGADQPRTARFTFTAAELDGLKEAACAVGGFLDTEPCEWALPTIARDAGLTALSKAAAAVRRDTNANFIAHRGALMHTDIAMMGLAAPASIENDARRQSSVRMSFSDGQQTALTEADLHWEFARRLLDLVAAPGTIKPAPSGDAMVRRWYVATAAWTELNGHHENIHMARGREIFPDDPDLAMLTGAQHELYATAAVQTAVRSAFLPTGVRLSVESERVELREAERFLRRATELKPDFAEARIRLGRVLAIMGRDADAAEHLRRGLADTDEHLLLYYGSLFLGAVEENLGHADAAKAAYLQAAALFPRAQSPLLGLSELARRGGHRDEALREMEKVYALQSAQRGDSDPWWTYNRAQGRTADDLLDALQKPFQIIDPR